MAIDAHFPAYSHFLWPVILKMPHDVYLKFVAYSID